MSSYKLHIKIMEHLKQMEEAFKFESYYKIDNFSIKLVATIATDAWLQQELSDFLNMDSAQFKKNIKNYANKLFEIAMSDMRKPLYDAL